jgi:hypothetical protein
VGLEGVLVSAPAVPVTGPATLRRGTKAGVDRWGGVVELWLRAHTAIVYAFLYLPIVIVVLFSFNANRLATIWTGFSLEWYGTALGDEVVQAALLNSFSVAVPNAILATAFGTMAALGLQRVGRKLRTTFDALTYISIIVPEIVIALSTLVLFASSFSFINDAVVQHLDRAAARPGPAVRDGPDDGRGLIRPVRVAVANLPPDHAPAAAARDRRRVPAGVHVLVRRLRDHVVRFGPGFVHAPDLHLRPGQEGREPGDQRRRDDDAGVHAVDACRGPVRPDPQLAPLPW